VTYNSVSSSYKVTFASDIGGNKSLTIKLTMKDLSRFKNDANTHLLDRIRTMRHYFHEPTTVLKP
jgi:hypothetical protein